MQKKNNPYYTGEPTPKHLKHGPVDDRSCTDVLCLLLFLIFWVAIGALTYYSYKFGHPMALTYVYNENGDPCGIDGQADYPYLLFRTNIPNTTNSSTTASDVSDSTYDLFEYGVCVQSCPSTNDTISCGPEPDASDGNCTVLGYPSTTFVDRFCVPTNPVVLEDLYSTSVFTANFFYQSMNDLARIWWMVLVVAAIALVLGFIYLFLMKFFSGLLLWGLVTAFIIVLILFGVICLDDAQGSETLSSITPSRLSAVNPIFVYAISIVCFLVAFITVVVVCCFRRKISLSLAVLKAASDFIDEEKSTLFVPPLLFVFTMIYYIFWIFVGVYLIGTMDATADSYVDSDGITRYYPIGDLNWNMKVNGMLIFHIFSLFWNHCFGVALSQFIIASSVCLWYFTQGKPEARLPVVWTSVKRSILHMGSLAFGSLVIGVLAFVRALIDFFHKRLVREGNQSEEKGFCLTCCTCCFKCFEGVLKFLTRHAYIQIAMTGENFCKAAEEAFFLLTRNAVRFGLVHGLAWMFLLLGQLFISLLSTFLGYLVITKVESIANDIYNPTAPTILFFLVSWLIADIFMGIYGISADSIIHCFAMDEEIHDGAAEHAPKQLASFINGRLHKNLLADS